MSKKIDILGIRYGSLVPFKDNGNGYWECYCYCGSVNCRGTRIAFGKRLRNSGIKTCGARNHALSDVIQIKRNSYSGIFKYGYDDGNLTLDQFICLVNYNCFYCGGGHSNTSNSYIRQKEGTFSRKNGEISYNGLDRISSDYPHDFENCVTSCIYCNQFKKRDKYENFLKRISNLNENFTPKIATDFNFISSRIKEYYKTGECENSRAKTVIGKVFPDKIKNEGCGSSLQSQVYQRKIRAVNNGSIWELSFIETAELILADCIYCGKTNNLNNKEYGTIDRYNNFDYDGIKTGYTLENSVPACDFCNCAKRDLTPNEFKNWIIRIKANKVNLPKTIEELNKYIKNRNILINEQIG